MLSPVGCAYAHSLSWFIPGRVDVSLVPQAGLNLGLTTISRGWARAHDSEAGPFFNFQLENKIGRNYPYIGLLENIISTVLNLSMHCDVSLMDAAS